jgi:hypothetical protein
MARIPELWGFCGDAAEQEAAALEGTVSFPVVRTPDTRCPDYGGTHYRVGG